VSSWLGKTAFSLTVPVVVSIWFVEGEDLSRRDPLLLCPIERVHGESVAEAELLLDLWQEVFGDAEHDRDGLQLGDHQQAPRYR